MDRKRKEVKEKQRRKNGYRETTRSNVGSGKVAAVAGWWWRESLSSGVLVHRSRLVIPTSHQFSVKRGIVRFSSTFRSAELVRFPLCRCYFHFVLSFHTPRASLSNFTFRSFHRLLRIFLRSPCRQVVVEITSQSRVFAFRGKRHVIKRQVQRRWHSCSWLFEK